MLSRPILVVTALLALCAVVPARAADGPSEDVVKLALAYKITRFIDWPAKAGDEPFRFCVTSSRMRDIANANLKNRKIKNRALDIVKVGEKDQPEQCDALYISAAEFRQVVTWLDQLAESPVLTISDAPEFAATGGIIGLQRKLKRIGMQINLDASNQAGLTINSQLLQLAEVIETPREASR